MNELQKRNAGIGYITSNTDDMLSSVINQYNIVNDNTNWISKGLFSCIYRKIFDEPTKNKYRYYFNMFGFQMDNFFDTTYVEDIINHVKTSTSNVGYFSWDSDWVRASLTNELSSIPDIRVKEAIIEQLGSGIRIKDFSLT